MTSRPGHPKQEERQSLEVAARIGYRFKDTALLQRALTHKSFVFDETLPEPAVTHHYESLEFLGDSILGFAVSELLYRTFPNQDEGTLSRMKSYLVSADQLAEKSRQLGLGDFLRLSRGENMTGGRDKRTILADLFESVVAAIYLDGGFNPAREFIWDQLAGELESLGHRNLELKDFKSALQEHLHQASLAVPVYRVVRQKGPDHQKVFVVEVLSSGETLGTGIGPSKKKAEQRAAQAALVQFGVYPPRET